MYQIKELFVGMKIDGFEKFDMHTGVVNLPPGRSNQKLRTYYLRCQHRYSYLAEEYNAHFGHFSVLP
jgi:hypothetical protein